MLRFTIQNTAMRLTIASALLQVIGCSSADRPATEQAARDALVEALDAWKAGRTAEDMRRETPEVIVGDAAWKQGWQLVGYEIGHGTFDGKNLRVPVTLTLAQPPGRNRKVVGNYIVGARPVVTIFRDSD